MQGMKENKNKNNNKCKGLSCDDEEEKEEQQECHKKSNEKGISDDVIDNKNYKCKENEMFKLIKRLKGEVKIAGKTRSALEQKGVHVEDCCETLVEKLKTELCRVKFLNQEEEILEVENIRKSSDNEFVVDTTLEHFEEYDEDEESEEQMENDEEMSSEDVIESEKESECEESEHKESEEKDECECGDLLGRMLDGSCLNVVRRNCCVDMLKMRNSQTLESLELRDK